MQDEQSGMVTPVTPMFSSGASTPRDITEAHFK
jgi:hypothetical protein